MKLRKDLQTVKTIIGEMMELNNDKIGALMTRRADDGSTAAMREEDIEEVRGILRENDALREFATRLESACGLPLDTIV